MSAILFTLEDTKSLMKFARHFLTMPLAALLLVGLLAGCAAVTPAAPEAAATEAQAPAGDRLVVYSGRSESLVGPLIEQFEAASGLDVEVRYGGTPEMAATILEEGDNSPADVFFGQDAGSLGALAQAGRLSPLPEALLNQVDARFRGPNGDWVGASGRARVLVYNTDELQEGDLPADVFALTGPEWQGKVGWAPTNASFQSFVTALRQLDGDEATRQWLEAMLANDVQSYDGNPAIVEAVGKGEIMAGLVNHYYLYRFLAEQGESFPARNHYFPDGGADALINIAGAGIVNTSRHRAAAEQFLAYLLSPEAQQYFADETNEYPLVAGIEVNPLLTPIDQLNPPQLDLGNLADLQGTIELLQDVGALQ